MRAYSGAVKAGLEASKIITKTGGLNWKYRQIIPDLANTVYPWTEGDYGSGFCLCRECDVDCAHS